MDIRTFFSKTGSSSSSTPVMIKKKNQEEPQRVEKRSLVESDEEFETKSEAKDEIKSDIPVIKKLKTVEIPRGTANCLNGKAFVLTGMLDDISRENAIDIVKRCGGIVQKAVSGRTHYLVAGSRLENGDDVSVSSKYKAAIERKIQILNQSSFLSLIRESSEKMAKENKGKGPQKAPLSIKGKGKQRQREISSELWPDKHKPVNTKDTMGNAGIAAQLKSWLIEWNGIHVKGLRKIKFNPKLSENKGAKMALLSGPPGIGKSTLAALVAKEAGFDITEFNASDVRSKKSMQNGGLRDIVQNTSICFDTKSSSPQLRQRVVIMDEVDGMSAGDRGGMTELISIIKGARIPIICICNDRQSVKVRSLANHSLDLRFRRPTKQQISSRMIQIAAKENMTVEPNAIGDVIERFGNDIRQVLNFLQMWKRKKDTLTYDDVKQEFYQMQKDTVLRMNPFSATTQIFQSGLTYEQRNEAYFVDYDLMPLMVQENYMSSILNKKCSLDEKSELAYLAADYISESDLLNKYVRMDQRWDLLTKQAAMNIAAATVAQGFVGRPEFSKWMGKNSTTGKSKRLVQELSMHLRTHSCSSFEAIRMDYIPYLRDILLTQLHEGSQDSINRVVSTLDDCEISREDLTESMEHFQMTDIHRLSYTKDIDSKTKSALTRMYNKQAHRAQGLAEGSSFSASKSKKKKGPSSAAAEEDTLEDAEGINAEDDDDDDDNDVSKFIKTNKPAAESKKSTAGSSSSAKRKPAKGKGKAR